VSAKEPDPPAAEEPSRPLVLVVEDEAPVMRFLRATLQAHGYRLAEATSGQQGLAEATTRVPDLILLDLGLPDLDGVEVIRGLRGWTKVPILVLSARSGSPDKVDALDAGADDYVTKPFGRQELLARVEAHLRRVGERVEQSGTYADGLVTIDFAQREVTVGGNAVTLTPLEFKLLSTFVRHPNQVLSHEQLLELVWNDALSGSRARTKLYVGYLRQKLATGDANGSPIETVRGFGYRYRPRTA
jgi:two-component system, OmpR family, KDP operon response regulator KdpE